MPARKVPAPADAIPERCHHACDDARRRPARLELSLVVLLLARGSDGAVAPTEVWTAVAAGHRVIDPPNAVSPRRILGVADPTAIIGGSCELCWPMIADGSEVSASDGTRLQSVGTKALVGFYVSGSIVHDQKNLIADNLLYAVWVVDPEAYFFAYMTADHKLQSVPPPASATLIDDVPERLEDNEHFSWCEIERAAASARYVLMHAAGWLTNVWPLMEPCMHGRAREGGRDGGELGARTLPRASRHQRHSEAAGRVPGRATCPVYRIWSSVVRQWAHEPDGVCGCARRVVRGHVGHVAARVKLYLT